MQVLAFAPNGSTLLGAVPEVIAASGMEELEDQGGGSVTVPMSVAKQYASLFAVRNVMKIVVDGRVVAAWVVRRKENVLVDGSGVQTVQFSGPGLLSWLEDAVLHHEFQSPYSAKTRWFHWGSLSAGSSGWGAPTKVRKRGGSDFDDPENPFRKKPANWPDMGDEKPWWIWDRMSDVDAPAGWVYFRREFEVAVDGTLLTLYLTANNRCHALLDGEPLVQVKERKAYKRTYEIDLELDAGLHVLGIAAKNKGSFAGLIAAMLQFEDDDDETGTPEFWTGQAGWKCKGYPSETPGWTAGGVLAKVIAEAASRGVASVGRYSLGFGSSADSDGVAWEQYPFSFDVGMSYWEMAQDLLDYGVQLAVDPDTLTLDAFAQRGTDRRSSVFLDVAAHLTEATDSLESQVKNTLLVETKDGWETHTDGTSVGSYGRIEGYVDLSQLSDKRVTKVVDATLKRSKIPVEGVTASFVPTVGNVPWVDFGVGDYVSVSQPEGGYKARKVISISVAVDTETGAEVYAVELDAISKDRLDRLQRVIDATGMQAGTLAGSTPKKNRGKTPPGDNDDPGDYRDPKPVYDPPGVDVDPPPDDPGWDEEGEFDVGDVSMQLGNEMLDGWKQFGDPLKVILLKSEPTNAAGEWVLGDHEHDGDGYLRGEINLNELSAPQGHDPVYMSNEMEVMCGGNVGATDWEAITHVAVASNDGTDLLSVVALTVPVTIEPDQTCTFVPGDIRLAVRTV